MTVSTQNVTLVKFRIIKKMQFNISIFTVY